MPLHVRQFHLFARVQLRVLLYLHQMLAVFPSRDYNAGYVSHVISKFRKLPVPRRLTSKAIPFSITLLNFVVKLNNFVESFAICLTEIYTDIKQKCISLTVFGITIVIQPCLCRALENSIDFKPEYYRVTLAGTCPCFHAKLFAKAYFKSIVDIKAYLDLI